MSGPRLFPINKLVAIGIVPFSADPPDQ